MQRLDAEVDGFVKSGVPTFLVPIQDLEGVGANLGTGKHAGIAQPRHVILAGSSLDGAPHDQQQGAAVLKFVSKVRPAAPTLPYKASRSVPELSVFDLCCIFETSCYT